MKRPVVRYYESSGMVRWGDLVEVNHVTYLVKFDDYPEPVELAKTQAGLYVEGYKDIDDIFFEGPEPLTSRPTKRMSEMTPEEILDYVANTLPVFINSNKVPEWNLRLAKDRIRNLKREIRES